MLGNPPWDLRLPVDGTSFENRAAENDELLWQSVPNPGTFLQLAVQASRKVAFGAGGSVVFAAAATSSAVVTHGLTTTPTVVLITLTGNTGIALTTPCQIYAQTFTATQFTCFIALGAAATGTLFFNWAAIG